MVNWIFHTSVFLSLFMMYFKCGLNFTDIFFKWYCFSITFTLIFNKIISLKIIYFYWFIIISFFMLKKIPNISNYSAFNCFIFIFWSKNISYTFNCGIIYFFFEFFQSKNISYIFNYVFYSVFIFFSLEFIIIVCCRKN